MRLDSVLVCGCLIVLMMFKVWEMFIKKFDISYLILDFEVLKRLVNWLLNF